MSERPTELEAKQLELFVRAFVPKLRQPRWLVVLDGPPGKWARLRMDDLFEVAGASALVRLVEIESELRTRDLADNPSAVMFRFSRKPYLLRGRLRQLIDEIVEDDAVILVGTGSLALGCHHSGDWVVCRR